MHCIESKSDLNYEGALCSPLSVLEFWFEEETIGLRDNSRVIDGEGWKVQSLEPEYSVPFSVHVIQDESSDTTRDL